MLRRRKSQNLRTRPLRFESLEDRRVLAAVSVDIADDFVDVNVNTINIPTITSPGGAGPDGKISLREAIAAANNTPLADTILFDLPPNQDTITLTEGELSITKSVTIDTVGQDITIDANNGSRVFTINASSSSGEVKLSGLTITGGDSSLNGGGLYFDSSAFPSGDVTLTPY